MNAFSKLAKPLYMLRRMSRRLWVRTTLIAVLALLAAGSSRWIAEILPGELAERVSRPAVERILEILAASMLTVTTFSLSVMVAARQWASSQSTPRAQKLMREDAVTQNALATFLGAFVFSLVSYILLTTGAYGAGAEVVILGFTLVVVALVVMAILRWIHHLTSLGGVDQTAGRVEDVAREALVLWRESPCLGARPLEPGTDRTGLSEIASPETGFVRHVDVARLQDCAENADGRVVVLAGPGTFLARGEPLALVSEGMDGETVAGAFTLGKSRNFDQDPLFGLEVLSEIAERALSPGVNDPGTAIDVIGRLTRLLMPGDAGATPDIQFDRVHVAPLDAGALCRTGFAGIARCAENTDTVHLALQRALRRLAEEGAPDLAEAARSESKRALAFAKAAITWDPDFERVAQASP